ncbi:MAG TPA: CocE/NonD family hydrolase [Candidatus Rubrimentiphilum sp.]|nr:CocE/NonD family hydrolase [Candidatus Rubrimentiphilum sp.]
MLSRLLMIATLIAQWAPAADPNSLADPAKLAQLMPVLARQTIESYKEPDRQTYLTNLFPAQIVAGDYDGARTSIDDLRAVLAARGVRNASLFAAPSKLYVDAKLIEAQQKVSFAQAYALAFRRTFKSLSDADAMWVADQLIGQVTSLHSWNFVANFDLHNEINSLKTKSALASDDVVTLLSLYSAAQVFNSIWDLTTPLQRQDAERRFVISEHVHIRTGDGAMISAVMVRQKAGPARRPTALIFTIYAQPPIDVLHAEYAAARGYIGITAYSRGKGDSTDPISPYEYDGRDANAVIDWIARQSWSNGSVGMYGGSYNGFTQWAAAKWHNPALKTIVPYVANNPGNGLPMENNIPLFVNYAWIYYAANNRYLDDAGYNDAHFIGLNSKWYHSGKSYSDVDAIAGVPNPWFHRWLSHPDFDAYWQSMVPYKDDFAKINIPVLTFTGYYDDGQGSAIGFLRDHYAYNPRAVHYLIIGPYDHLGTQRSHKEDVLRDYPIDPVAQIDTPAITFEWFDYVMRGRSKPAILADRINYEVMGANQWRHAPKLDAMSTSSMTFYLSNQPLSGFLALSQNKPVRPEALTETVDFADRKTLNNGDSYPFPILGKEVDFSEGYTFITDPLDHAISVNGQFSGQINAILNKRDVDFGVVLYEVTPDNKLFQLSYFIGRASYANDMSKRVLLNPREVVTIPFDRTRVVSRQLSKGSRLLLTLDVNKNAFAEINYGTGGDVSREDVKDAKTPLKISWLTDSYVNIPVSN